MQSSLFSPAFAVWNQRHAIQQLRNRLLELFNAVADPESLSLPQWVHLVAAVLEFKPDLVLELGRNVGNSTCAFTEAANQIGNCRVVSLCRAEIWQKTTQQQVRQIVPDVWFDPLDAQVVDILYADTKAILADSQRVCVLWDAHGFDVADYVLGSLMPLLRSRQHIVLVHDISDLRYSAGQEGYRGKSLWRFGNDNVYTDHQVKVVLGHLSSSVEQTIALVDFASRNHLSIHSADESFYTELNQEQTAELAQQLGEEFFSCNGHWVWFSLNEKEKTSTIHFPAFTLPNPKEIESEVGLELLQAEVMRLKNTITAMESSKFWKLRSGWLSLKNTLKVWEQ
jgi:hypothetical protein